MGSIMEASSPLVARAEELYLAYEMDGLPAALRRNSIDYYYLSVYPGLAEMADLEESDLPSYPDTLRAAYVHIPFCSGLCSFCSYFLTTVKAGQDAPIHAYLELVKQELAFHQEHATIDLSVVYFGGGTPSLIPPAMLAELFDFMTDRRILASGRRYGTVELHPEFFADLDAAQEFVDVLRANGITRVSVGLESADPGILDGANRRHDGSFLSEAMGFLRGNGLHVNLDLMYGIPGLSAASWEESLRTSTASEPDSISAYFLFLDRGTALRTDVDRGKVALPTHREIQVQHLMAQLHLAECGYHELPNDFYAKISVDPATF